MADEVCELMWLVGARWVQMAAVWWIELGLVYSETKIRTEGVVAFVFNFGWGDLQKGWWGGYLGQEWQGNGGGGGEGTTKSETVLLSSPNIIRVIKPRMRWAVHVACMGEMRVVYPQGSDAETWEETGRLEDPDGDGRIILRWILKKDCAAWSE